MGITDGHKPSGGQWAGNERMHINLLEFKAAFIGIRTYFHNRSYKHSQTALRQLHTLLIKVTLSPKKIWSCCFKNNSFLFAAHLPGKHNIEADTLSRKININTE